MPDFHVCTLNGEITLPECTRIYTWTQCFSLFCASRYSCQALTSALDRDCIILTESKLKRERQQFSPQRRAQYTLQNHICSDVGSVGQTSPVYTLETHNFSSLLSFNSQYGLPPLLCCPAMTLLGKVCPQWQSLRVLKQNWAYLQTVSFSSLLLQKVLRLN